MLTPLSTYRLQFNKTFTFRQALDLVDYLESLGVSTVYASPIMQAVPGSNHGYDVTDFSELNPELGTLDELETLVHALCRKQISWIQDIVPNHMNFSAHNHRLWDVLKRGQDSPYASYFDIDWAHPLFGNRLLVPFLERPLQELIDSGRFRLVPMGKDFGVSYNGIDFPLNEESCPALRREALQGEDLLLRLAALSRDRSLLQSLLGRQHYLLAPYHRTDREINYRRFFAINSLIGLRMEDEHVFDAYHRLPLELHRKGWIQGLRVDHIDGLRDPYGYVDRLRTAFGPSCYIIAEKILETNETLSPGLGLQGTSGYEFLGDLNQVLTRQGGAETLVSFYQELVPDCGQFSEVVLEKKAAYLRMHMNGEWNNLVRYLLDKELIAGALADALPLKEALGLLVACFPVYRVYPRTDGTPLDEQGRRFVSHAFREAMGRAPDLFFVLEQLRSLFEPGHLSREPHRLEFLQKLMQLTGAIAAKGVEDTTFYCYTPLISHNEVGSAPTALGMRHDRFHEKMAERLRETPLALNATSTHDTKRGEDARLRINLLSELPQEWIALVRSWLWMNKSHKTWIGSRWAPVVNDEYFIYQSILGAFPEDGRLTLSFSERTQAFMQKALREAGTNSSHTAPNTTYEEACARFIDRLLDPTGEFIQTFLPFFAQIRRSAETYSLAMVVLKSTLPGIPDFFQGSELWNLCYVDPDNRDPVCFTLRKRLLKAPGEHPKLLVTQALLHLRRRRPELFIQGEYIPLGIDSPDVLAYARRWRDQWVIVVVPVTRVIAGAPKPIPLPVDAPGHWTHLFTGQIVDTGKSVDLEKLSAAFPVTVLESR